MRSRVRGGAAAVALGGLLVAGCGGGGTGSADEDPGRAGNAGSGAQPVSVTDCTGARTTFSSTPRRIVTSNASGLELLLRLRAGDKVIGTGFPPGKGIPPGALDAARKVEVLGRTVIPHSVALRRADATWTLMPRAEAAALGRLVELDGRPSHYEAGRRRP